MTFVPETSEQHFSPSTSTISIVLLGQFPSMGFAARLDLHLGRRLTLFLMMNPASKSFESDDTSSKVDLSRIAYIQFDKLFDFTSAHTGTHLLPVLSLQIPKAIWIRNA